MIVNIPPSAVPTSLDLSDGKIVNRSLEFEGIANALVHDINNARKSAGMRAEDKIQRIAIGTSKEPVLRAWLAWEQVVRSRINCCEDAKASMCMTQPEHSGVTIYHDGGKFSCDIPATEEAVGIQRAEDVR